MLHTTMNSLFGKDMDSMDIAHCSMMFLFAIWISWLLKYTWVQKGRHWLSDACGKKEKPLWEIASDNENELDFILPPEAAEFDELYYNSDETDEKEFLASLLKRAIADVPKFQTLSRVIKDQESLFKQHLITTATWSRVERAKDQMDAEFEEVRRLADELKPNWSATIFKQAATIVHFTNLKEKKEQIEALKQLHAERERRRKVGEEKHAQYVKEQQRKKDEKKKQKAYEAFMKTLDAEKKKKMLKAMSRIHKKQKGKQ